ncbi:MAG: single-stranded-DNA-specific exonuclease RecJ [Anaerolineales bacterium]
MKLDNYRWRYPEPVPLDIQAALDTFSKPFQSILYQRDLTSPDEVMSFLLPKNPAWASHHTLRHIDRACQIIQNIVDSDQPIGIFGDYDADGITATALLTLALRKIHAPILPMIPNRLEDGYGLNKKSLDEFSRAGAALVITVDNGIRAFEEALYAKQLGIELIITDHHRPADKLPEASAVIDPKTPDDPYPNKYLAGVGVAYKLVCGLASIYELIDPDEFLDLVAIGTIADIVPLLGENRYLVKKGLNLINSKPRQAIHSLLGTAGLIGKKVTASDISFQIAPRLNSSGRLESEDSLVPLQLLLSQDTASCGSFAQVLENHNFQRKTLSKELQESVERQFLEIDPLPPILVALNDQVNLGVAGIAAGYLSRKFYLPAIVGKTGDATTTASCRSIPEFDIIAALENISDLFEQFGGHKLAAGFTLPNANLPAFQAAIIEQAKQHIDPLDLHPTLEIDAQVTLPDLNQGLYKEISKLEPTGEKNPPPVFCIKGLGIKKTATVGAGGDHLKLTLSDGTYLINAIGFNFGELAPDLPKKVDVAFHFTENQYRGQREFQLQILDLSAC